MGVEVVAADPDQKKRKLRWQERQMRIHPMISESNADVSEKAEDQETHA